MADESIDDINRFKKELIDLIFEGCGLSWEYLKEYGITEGKIFSDENPECYRILVDALKHAPPQINDKIIIDIVLKLDRIEAGNFLGKLGAFILFFGQILDFWSNAFDYSHRF